MKFPRKRVVPSLSRLIRSREHCGDGAVRYRLAPTGRAGGRGGCEHRPARPSRYHRNFSAALYELSILRSGGRWRDPGATIDQAAPFATAGPGAARPGPVKRRRPANRYVRLLSEASRDGPHSN